MCAWYEIDLINDIVSPYQNFYDSKKNLLNDINYFKISFPTMLILNLQYIVLGIYVEDIKLTVDSICWESHWPLADWGNPLIFAGWNLHQSLSTDWPPRSQQRTYSLQSIHISSPGGSSRSKIFVVFMTYFKIFGRKKGKIWVLQHF